MAKRNKLIFLENKAYLVSAFKASEIQVIRAELTSAAPAPALALIQEAFTCNILQEVNCKTEPS